MFISFLFLSEERRKKRTKERRKKRVRTQREKRSHNAARVFDEQKDASANISTKMLVKHSHFRDVLSVLRLILCFRVLREQLGSISCTQNSLVLLSEFSVSRSVLPRAFFLLFGAFFFFLFRKKGRKMRIFKENISNKKILNYTQNIRLTQIKNKNQSHL